MLMQCVLKYEGNVITVVDSSTQMELIRLTDVDIPFVYEKSKRVVKQSVEVPSYLATAEEVGKVLGIQPTTVRQLSARGEIDGCVIFNGRKYWNKEVIYDLARKLEKGNAQT